jgi:uncharacterized membrane protein
MPPAENRPTPPVVDRNIDALLARRRDEERRRTFNQRLSDRVTAFAGSVAFVYCHLAIFGVWIVANLPAVPWPRFDPSFVKLAMVASVEAIFLSTFVLISQNRLTALSEKRAELDLQVSLLTERRITRLVRLVDAMARKMDLCELCDEEIESLKEDVTPEVVLDRLEEKQQGE